MGRVEGKVALITGAARGQGRSHAVRLAEEGADIIAVDVCEEIPFFSNTARPEDLAETVALVEALGQRIVARQADVRDFAGLSKAVDEGVAELGRLDIVVANAGGSGGFARAEDLAPEGWQATLDVNLNGVWHTYKAAIPHIRAGGHGGSIVITSSGASLKGAQNLAHYVASKTGQIGLMKTLALELAPERVRVNVIAPGNVNTRMINNEGIFRAFRPDLENPGIDDVVHMYEAIHALPTPWVEPVDVSNAVLFLSSDEGRFITGVTLPVDAGHLLLGPTPSHTP